MTNVQPYLGRCQSCDYVLFSTAEDLRPAETLNEVNPGAAYRLPNGVFARCINRHRVFKLKQIEGTFSKDHQCDSRCLNARGWKCTCSCGGANHGRGHVAIVHEAGKEPVEKHLGTVGSFIRGKVKVQNKKVLPSDATLYIFLTLDGSARIKWFAPSYADPDFEVGEEMECRAKVKRHEDDERWGKATIVTDLEKV